MRKFRPLQEPIRLQDLLNSARSRAEKKIATLSHQIMKLLHHIMIKTHHVRTTLQDIMKKPHNLIYDVTTTHNEETTQNYDKQRHKKVMAFHNSANCVAFVTVSSIILTPKSFDVVSTSDSSGGLAYPYISGRCERSQTLTLLTCDQAIFF